MKRFVVVSTWGQHHILALNEDDAMEAIEDEGYHVNDGMTQEYDPDYHGAWEAEET